MAGTVWWAVLVALGTGCGSATGLNVDIDAATAVADGSDTHADAVTLDLPVTRPVDAGVPTDGACGTLPVPVTPVISACPSGDQCPGCTGTALPEGTYLLRYITVFASGCGLLSPRGALRLAGGTYESVVSIATTFDPSNPMTQVSRSTGRYTVLPGGQLLLDALCPAGSQTMVTYGTTADGTLKITAAMGATTVYQRQ